MPMQLDLAPQTQAGRSSSRVCPLESIRLKDRALRTAAPLRLPHGSGGPFHELPLDVRVQVLCPTRLARTVARGLHAHVSRTCLQFNDAAPAVSKGVLSAVRGQRCHDEGAPGCTWLGLELGLGTVS